MLDSHFPQFAALALLAALLAGCAHTPIQPSGLLSSYDGMKQDPGIFTRSLGRADKKTLKEAWTVSIVPVAFSPTAAEAGLSPEHQHIVANATSRALCNELSRQFKIVPEGMPSDLTVRGAITKVKVTDATASAVSQVGNVAASVFAPFPVPLKRLPIGLGGLTIEAEAVTPDGRQVAGIVWESDANPFASKPRVSAAGDAYDLAANFSSEFARVLRQKQFELNPRAMLAALPTPGEVVDNVTYAIDGKATSRACEMFGDGPGLIGAIAGNFGAPPEWTDKGQK